MAVRKLEWCRLLSSWPGVSDGAFRTGFVLVEFYDFQKEDLWSAQKTLAEKRGKSERAIRDHIAELIDVGFLESRRGGAGQSNRYVLTLPDRQKSASLKSSDRQDSASKTGKALPLKTGENLPHHSNPLKEPLEQPLEPEQGHSALSPGPGSEASASVIDADGAVQASSTVSPTSTGRKPAGSGRRNPDPDAAALRQIAKAWAIELSEAETLAARAALKVRTAEEICAFIRLEVSGFDLCETLAKMRRETAE